MTLSQQLLEEQEVAYEAEEDQYAEEMERIESLPSSFADGSWSIEDMEWIVRWKSSRSIGYFERNDPDEVKDHVNVRRQVVLDNATLSEIDIITQILCRPEIQIIDNDHIVLFCKLIRKI